MPPEQQSFFESHRRGRWFTLNELLSGNHLGKRGRTPSFRQPRREKNRVRAGALDAHVYRWKMEVDLLLFLIAIGDTFSAAEAGL